MTTILLCMWGHILSFLDYDLLVLGYTLLYAFPKQALVFMCLQYKSFENTAGKGEIAHNEQFLLLPQCFLPI